MGRWGLRLFESDLDIDIALDINKTFGACPDNLNLSKMVHQTDMLAPPEARSRYQTKQYKGELAEIVTKARDKLDADDLGQRLLSHWRTKESDSCFKYHGHHRRCFIDACGCQDQGVRSPVKSSHCIRRIDLIQDRCLPQFTLKKLGQLLSSLDSFAE
ncbi:hypothetical protein GGR52DRAFT_546846 [Hypoxylon sp. FL1284]|nr:hypothetical protein GGR52DRAFT_546846 [Hypoxylon sp. FL1284]